MSNLVEILTEKYSKQHTRDAPSQDMVWIPGGTFRMGSDKHYPEEAPAHQVTVDGFWMDQHTVTNEEFRKFVDAIKYVTLAEHSPKAEDYPGAKAELLVPASVVFHKPRQRGRSKQLLQLVELPPWRELAPSGRTGKLFKRARQASRSSCRVRRC
jgi:formylglycine-generating enzyme required for sulfatase activity